MPYRSRAGAAARIDRRSEQAKAAYWIITITANAATRAIPGQKNPTLPRRVLWQLQA
jgi:hypothetical protein